MLAVVALLGLVSLAPISRAQAVKQTVAPEGVPNNGAAGQLATEQPGGQAGIQNAGGGGLGNGANVPGPYDPTGVGSNQPGSGGGGAVGMPDAGTVGNADAKNPPGQLPGGGDLNKGYECDNQSGVGNGNPAHTGCVVDTTTTTGQTTAATIGTTGTTGTTTGTTGGTGQTTGQTTGGGGGHTPVTICHVTGNGSITITVDDDAVQAHLDHGDSLGECPAGTTTGQTTGDTTGQTTGDTTGQTTGDTTGQTTGDTTGDNSGGNGEEIAQVEIASGDTSEGSNVAAEDSSDVESDDQAKAADEGKVASAGAEPKVLPDTGGIPLLLPIAVLLLVGAASGLIVTTRNRW